MIPDNTPYTILRLDLRCNARCLFCNVPEESCGTQSLTTREAKNKITALLKKNKDLRLDISGGEPTLRPDLPEIVGYASKQGVKTIQIQTNAIKLADRSLVRQLKKSGLRKAFVALHSHRAPIHDMMTEHRGAFKKCTQGIKHLLRAGIRVSLNPVITRFNAASMPHYPAFLKKMFTKPIESISLSVVQPYGRALLNPAMVPTYGEISFFIQATIKAAEARHIPINNPYCGAPLCVGSWYRALNRCVEYHMSPDAKKSLLTNTGGPKKIHGSVCQTCALKTMCNGVWETYANLYGFGDLVPPRSVKLPAPEHHPKDNSWPISPTYK